MKTHYIYTIVATVEGGKFTEYALKRTYKKTGIQFIPIDPTAEDIANGCHELRGSYRKKFSELDTIQIQRNRTGEISLSISTEDGLKLSDWLEKMKAKMRELLMSQSNMVAASLAALNPPKTK